MMFYNKFLSFKSKSQAAVFLLFLSTFLVGQSVVAAGITVNPTSGLVTTESSGTASFSIVLDSQPSAEVSIGVFSSDVGEGTIAPSVVTFTSSDWDQPKSVQVTGVDDEEKDGDQSFQVITSASASADPAYNGINPSDVQLTNLDNEFTVTVTAGPGGQVGPTGSLIVQENDTATLFVVSNFGYQVSSVGGTCGGSQTGYLFVTEPVLGDCTLNFEFQSRIIGVPQTALVTTEWGASSSFELVLSEQPSGPVTITPASSDTGEGMVSSPIVFDENNWNTAQTLTITGIADEVADGDQYYTVSLSVSSSDPLFDQTDLIEIEVINLDHNKVQLTSGESHSAALRKNGVVWAWGRNTFGQLGQSSSENYITPVVVEGNAGFVNLVAVAAGANHTVALKSDGTVWAWGYNISGQVGNGSTDDAYEPFQVSGLSHITAIAAGFNHTLALRSDGTVWSWGDNGYRQLGDGGYTDQTSPVQVVGLTDVIAIAGGSRHSLALKADGTVWAWGTNTDGQLGDTTKTTRSTPVMVSALTGISAIASGTYHSLALKADGTVWAWGDNANGEMGNDTGIDATTPTQVPGLTSVVKIAGGGQYSQALTSGGDFYAWGYNGSDELGDGSDANQSSPVELVSLNGIVDVFDAGNHHAIALKSDGTLLAWGGNSYGQFGDSSTTPSPTPVAAGSGLNLYHGIDVTPVSGLLVSESGVSDSFSVVLLSEPSADVTISVTSTDTGEGTVSDAGLTFTSVNWDTPQTVTVSGVEDALTDGDQVFTITTGAAVSSDANYSGLDAADVTVTSRDNEPAVIVSTGSLVTTEWGISATFTLVLNSAPTQNVTIGLTSSDLGEGTVSPSSVTFTSANWQTPQQVTVTGVGDLLDDGDQVYTIITSATSSTDSSYNGLVVSNVQVTNLDDVGAQLSAGWSHSLSLKADGSVWAWGYNTYGQVGDGSNVTRTSPVKVDGLSDIVAVSSNYDFNLALKRDGTVWGWGRNSSGQLGDGTKTDRYYPVQVASLDNVVAISAGSAHSLALKSDGTVWAWGNNSGGQLGDGKRTSRLAPVQVPDLHDVKVISAGNNHNLVIKSNGTVWAWGTNTYGQIGDGSTTTRYQPVQISFPSSVKSVSAGYYFSLAVTTTGSAYAWGWNSKGQLGDGSTTDRYTPVSVSGLTNVEAIDAGAYYSVALKTDGTVWSWGWNTDGQMGIGTTGSDNTYYKTPEQAQGVTGIKTITAGYGHTLALKDNQGGLLGWGRNTAGQLGDGTTNSPVTTSIAAAGSLNLLYDIMVSPVDGLVTGESGDTDSFTVKLLSQPSATVTIGLSSSDPGEGSVSPASVSFGTGDWYTPKTVTVTGVNDADVDGDQAYSIVTAASSSSDVRYNGLDAEDVSVTNNDNEADIRVSAGTLLTTEWGGTGTFTVVLNTQPTADVTINLGSSDDSEGTVSPDSVTFTTSNWATPREVTVTGVDDSADDDKQRYDILISATSMDPVYNNIDPQDVAVFNLDDEVYLATGDYHTLVLKSDGTLWSWGSNYSGQLGDGTSSDRTSPVAVINMSNVKAVAAGQDHSLALKNDGTVWAWGNNSHGQLGDGTYDENPVPTRVAGVDSIVAIAAGEYQSFALKADGTLIGWGDNYNGEMAQTAEDYYTYPVVVSGISQVVAVDSGIFHSMALKSDGTVWTWGGNYSGQLGNGSTSNKDVPVQVPGLQNVISIAAGFSQSFALNKDGAVFAWGDNYYGQIGDGDTNTDVLSPVDIGLTDVSVVKTGDGFSVALKNDGTVLTWGKDYQGQLGNGTGGVVPDPTVVLNLTGVASIAAGYWHSVVLKADGTLQAWGYNSDGQLGDGTNDQSNTPINVAAGLNLYHEIQVTPVSGLVTTEQGSSDSFQLKLLSEPTSDVQIPLSVSDPTEGSVTPATITFTSANWSAYQTVTVTGVNDPDSDGNQDYTVVTAAAVSADTNYSGMNAADVSVTNVDDEPGIIVTYQSPVTAEWGAQATFTIVLNSQPSSDVSLNLSSSDEGEGTVAPSSVTFNSGNWDTPQTITVTGVSDNLDDGDQSYSIVTSAASSMDNDYDGMDAVDVPVINLQHNIAQLVTGTSFSLALRFDGKVLAWGLNSSGQLGDGTSTRRLTAVTVNGLNDVVAIAAGELHSLALKSDGTVWAWGYNYDGQLGDGTVITRYTPVMVQGLNNVVAIAAGSRHSLAVKSDGSVWAWGRNDSGQIGQDAGTDKVVPVKVTQPSGAIAVAGGYYHSLALLADGNVRAWGGNYQGQLGDGTTTDREVPVFVNGLAGVVAITAGTHHSMAVKSDGTVMAWGNNGYGRLGDNSTTMRESPVAVSGLTGVKAIAAGYDYSMALKTDGTVWGWGRNSYGQLTEAAAAEEHTAVQASGISSVIAIGGDYQHSLAMKADGTLWGWGRNSQGQLGNGTYINDPTTVPQLNTAPGIRIIAVADLVTSEAGAQASFDMRLLSPPIADVSFTISSSDSGEGTVSPSVLTFTASNWSQAQTVTITGVDDDINDGNQNYNVLISPASSADSSYNGLDTNDVAVVNTDADLVSPALTVITDSGYYNSSQSVVLLCADVESSCDKIYYTTDGNPPTTDSTVYTGPLVITTTTALKAMAVDNAGNQSLVETRDYTFDLVTPSVAVTAPANEALLAELAVISGTASDADSGIVQVDLQITDGTKSVISAGGQLTTSPPAWVAASSSNDWANWNYASPVWEHDTVYTIKARATDNAGNTSHTTHTFHYYNGTPAFTTLDLNLSASSVIYGGEADASFKLTKVGDPQEDLSGSEILLVITDPDYDPEALDNPGNQYVLGPFSTNADGQVTVTGLGKAGNGLLPDGDDADSEPDDLLFDRKGTWTLQAQYAGNLALKAANSSAQILLVGTSAGYAVIVEGKAPGGEGLASHNKTGNRVYRTLLDRGFADQNIFYFNYYYNDDTVENGFARSDANLDGTPDRYQLGVGMDGLPSKAMIQDVLTNQLSPLVAFNPAPVYLVMVDHGASDHRFLLDAESISPAELDSWLDDLENDLSILEPAALDEPRVAILGYCYSGGFIPGLSANNRLIITSSAADEESYKGALESDGIRVGEYFLEELFQELGKGETFKEAFKVATDKTETFTREGTSSNSANAYFDSAQQHPLLDDNANGQGSNVLDESATDGQLAALTILGTGPNYDTNSLENPAAVKQVTDTLFLDAGTDSAGLWLIAHDNAQVSQAYVEIRKPETTLSAESGTEQLEAKFISRILLAPGQVGNPYNDRFYIEHSSDGVTYTGFDQEGKYEIYYYVEDVETGNISPAKRSVVYKNKGANNAPTHDSGDDNGIWELKSPTDTDTTKTVVILDWEDAQDPDSDDLSYTVEIADSNNFDPQTATFNGQAGLYTIEELAASQAVLDASVGLLDQHSYYWRVKAIDVYGATTLSGQVWMFSTNNGNAPYGILKGIVYSDQNFSRLSAASILGQVGAISDLVVTAANGEYLILLPPGVASLGATNAGFVSKNLADIDVPVSTALTPYVELNIGMQQDVDSDGDGVYDSIDAFDNKAAASVDTDGDGQPDDWNTNCDTTCQSNSGLILDLDDDNDGMSDEYENANGLDPLVDDAAADLDEDGYTNLEEFEAGTAANDSNDTPRKSSVILKILPLILNQ